MDDTEKLIVEKKIDAIREAGPEVEYLVAGSAIGSEGLVPCVLDSQSGDQCLVTIADGPDTGVSVTVDRSQVTALGKEFFNDAASKLFK